jgi:hypothetical protein
MFHDAVRSKKFKQQQERVIVPSQGSLLVIVCYLSVLKSLSRTQSADGGLR